MTERGFVTDDRQESILVAVGRRRRRVVVGYDGDGDDDDDDHVYACRALSWL